MRSIKDIIVRCRVGFRTENSMTVRRKIREHTYLSVISKIKYIVDKIVYINNNLHNYVQLNRYRPTLRAVYIKYMCFLHRIIIYYTFFIRFCPKHNADVSYAKHKLHFFGKADELTFFIFYYFLQYLFWKLIGKEVGR